jgi:hypothetical protein
MLSSDKNVETIAQLVEVIKHYLWLQKEYLKFDVIDKVVRLLTAATLAIIFFLIVIAVTMFLSFALPHWLSAYIGISKAFLLVAGLHALILALFVVFRKAWIEKPLVRFLVNLFFEP